MKTLFLLFILLSGTTLIAQDYGTLLEQRTYGAYSIEYHEEYDGKKEDSDIYMEDEDGEKQFMGPKYTNIVVSIYERKVVIECTGPYSNSRSVYGKGKKLTGPNWYGYEISNMQLHISKVNTRIYSELEEVDDEEVFMMEEVFMNPQ
ncbi:MAG: hypothetical protein ACI976_000629 [Aureispira sp.]|jgi:hypothetical protein